jgi:hypothetical protein
MPRTPARPATPARPRRKAKSKDMTTMQTVQMPLEIPCAVHLELRMTWLGITLTKVTKPLVKP